MAHPTGEFIEGSLRLDFDRGLKLEFHGRRAPRGIVLDMDKLIKIGAKVVSRGRNVAFQMAEVFSNYLNPPRSPWSPPSYPGSCRVDGSRCASVFYRPRLLIVETSC